MSDVMAWADDLSSAIEKSERLIASASRTDPELAAGLASKESLLMVGRKIDRAIAATEELYHDMKSRKLAR